MKIKYMPKKHLFFSPPPFSLFRSNITEKYLKGKTCFFHSNCLICLPGGAAVLLSLVFYEWKHYSILQTSTIKISMFISIKAPSGILSFNNMRINLDGYNY